MSISLDIGTSGFRSLRRIGGELVGRSVPAAFALVADEPSARHLLSRADLAFADGDGELALVGEGAIQHAAALRATPLRLLPGGLVANDDPPARQLLATLIESLLPEPATSGERCGVVLPAASAADRASHEFLLRLMQMRGFTPLEISASHAVALASLSREGFTGIAMSFGAGGCSISVTHRGRELVNLREARGTDWIDAQIASAEKQYTHDAAGERYLDTESIRRQRESLADPLTRPTTNFAAQVSELYRELLRSILGELSRSIEMERLGFFATPFPVVCAGGGTRAAGFSGLMTAVLAATDFPLPVGQVRLARQDDYLVARGALINTELESSAAEAA